MRRTFLLGCVSAAVMGSSAWGETAKSDDNASEEIVVVATRRPLLVTESPAPVDVLSEKVLSDRGANDLAKKLQFLAPSFNYSRAATLASAVGTRPASLYGLGVDQVLVLVNGHRRHASSVLDTNNAFGRGTVPVDLNTIPTAAIARVEILRNGASAQYGSDAIAGVINVVLREDASGGLLSAQGGITENGQGASGIYTGRGGFKLGSSGFLTATGEIRTHDFTNSSAIDQRFGRVTQRIGEPKAFDGDLTLNGELPLSWGALYGYMNFGQRHTESSPLWRIPTTSPAFYPDGFLVLIEQNTTDVGATIGAHGTLGSWNWDLSDTVGYNLADFHVGNTVNTSLGTASPRSFDGGGSRYGQNLINLTLDRDFETVLAGAHLTLGTENRYEWYRLRPGEPSSYFGSGSQGFVGFNPSSKVNPDRYAFSAFVDGTLSPIKGLDLGLAGRFEHYSDFGSHVTGKASAFWKPIRFAALRATASTGIRAPSLPQQYYSSISSVFDAGSISPANPTGLLNAGTFAVNDPVAIALGASPLKAETSRNYSVGVVLTPTNELSFTADVFRIEIDDRITFSELLSGPTVVNILKANGIFNASGARFFTNAADTVTKGFELGLHWTKPINDRAVLSFNAGYADFQNKVTNLHKNSVLPNVPLLGPTSIFCMTTAQPANKWTFNSSLTWGPANFTVDVVRFGHYIFNSIGPTQYYNAVWSVDLTAAYDITDTLRLQGGIINATNQYPDEVKGAIDGRVQLETGGLGYDGREYNIRLTKSF